MQPWSPATQMACTPGPESPLRNWGYHAMATTRLGVGDPITRHETLSDCVQHLEACLPLDHRTWQHRQ